MCRDSRQYFPLRAVALLILLARNAADEGASEGSVPAALEVQVVAGSVAKLPCNIQPTDPRDHVHIVVWFKDGYRPSVYSFDSRGRQPDRAEQSMDVDVLEGRAFFRYGDSPATLAIENVQVSDAGRYRCRVDFVKSPTRNTWLTLSVVVPPEKLLLMDDQGSYVIGNTSRPYDEGAMVVIKCISVGGVPPPRVSWWQGGQLLDDTSEVSSSSSSGSGGRVENTVTLQSVGREHFLSQLTCQASNNRLLMPLTRTLLLDMNLKPAQVRMSGEAHPLSAGSKYKVQCEVWGSRPAPEVAWYMAGTPLSTYRVSTNPGGNLTVSTLYLTPTADDGGKVLTCRAYNSLVANSSLEAKRLLDVHHVPVAKLKMGKDTNDGDVVEGSDVHFDCSIKSNPWVDKVTWRHNGRRLYNNSTVGVVVGNQSLALHSVQRERTGSYTCLAENKEGYGESNAVNLDVKYAPVCGSAEPQLVGLSRRHEAVIVCRVSANPSEVSFSWTHGDAGEWSENMAASRSGNQSTVSIPAGVHMVGSTVLCTARNQVGQQRRPCIFRLVTAVVPDPLNNCSIQQPTTTSTQVKCSEGFDGGIPQQFAVEVSREDSGSLVTSFTADKPSFTLGSLVRGVALNLSMYAFNSEGRSEVVTLLIPATGQQQGLIAEDSVGSFMAPVFGSLAGVLLVLAVIIALQHSRSSGERAAAQHCDGSKPACPAMFDTPEDEFCSIPLRPEGATHGGFEPDLVRVEHGAYSPLESWEQ